LAGINSHPLLIPATQPVGEAATRPAQPAPPESHS